MQVPRERRVIRRVIRPSGCTPTIYSRGFSLTLYIHAFHSHFTSMLSTHTLLVEFTTLSLCVPQGVIKISTGQHDEYMADADDKDQNPRPTVINMGAPALGSSESDDKIRREKDAEMLKWIAKELNKRHEKSFHWRVLTPLIMVGLTLIGLIVCYMYCLPCLFGILVFSALTCGCSPIMNVPLWITILILIIRGWSLTNGHLTLIWT